MAHCFLHLLIVLILVRMLCAIEHGVPINLTAIGQRVNLTCHLGLQSNQNVEWSVYNGAEFIPIFTCRGTLCDRKNGHFSANSKFFVHQGETTSTFSFPRSQRNDEICQCNPENHIIQTYHVRFVDLDEIKSPYCNLSPRNQDGNLQIKLLCEFDISKILNASLAFEGVESDVYESHQSSSSIEGIIDQSTFMNNQNTSCKLSIPGTFVSRSCIYPKPVNIRESVEHNLMIFRCEVEPDVVVLWRLLDTELLPQDITNRTWTRDVGHSLLLQNIDSQDIGKIMECRTYKHDKDGNLTTLDSIGFTLITSLNRQELGCTGWLGGWLSTSSFYVILAVVIVCVTAFFMFVVWLICRNKSRTPTASQSPESSKSKTIETRPEEETSASKQKVVSHSTKNTSGSKETHLLHSLEGRALADLRLEQSKFETSGDFEQTEYEVISSEVGPSSNKIQIPSLSIRNDHGIKTRPFNLTKTTAMPEGNFQGCRRRPTPVVTASNYPSRPKESNDYQAQTEYEVTPSQVCQVFQPLGEHQSLGSVSKNDFDTGRGNFLESSRSAVQPEERPDPCGRALPDDIYLTPEIDDSQNLIYENLPK